MVGIGGGAPSSAHDIRLGDVVVSQPSGTIGGVIQYDRGKTVQGGEFQQTGALSAPPNILLTALGCVQADHECGDTQIPTYLSQMITARPKMRNEYCYQGALNDYLYRAEYDHDNPTATCEQCDPAQQIPRNTREDTAPVIHYGNIASGNQMMKHGTTRDQLCQELNVLCFEMEAAGLMPDFPCLVIRGICDYADSHKNNVWQKYAAATAAAFAKELLLIISPDQVQSVRSIPQLVSGE
jgi:nucleoside phosphorylase